MESSELIRRLDQDRLVEINLLVTKEFAQRLKEKYERNKPQDPFAVYYGELFEVLF